MRPLRRFAGRGAVVLGLLGAGLFLTGCGTGPPVYVDLHPKGATNKTSAAVATYKPPLFQVGDTVNVVFSPQELIQAHEEAIKEDGKITPPFVGSVMAAGKSAGQLQKDLQERYNKLYTNLTVTVIQPKLWWYYVRGEVRRPGPVGYLGDTDIVKAISAAGDFTEFANRKKVQITRASGGRTETVDVLQAIKDPRRTVPIYPGDTIHVPRKWL